MAGDGLAAEAFDDAPFEDLAYDGGAERVGDEAGLGLALAAAGGDGVGDAVGEVAVGRLADVVALDGVLFEAAPCLLQHFQDVPLGYALLDAASEDLGGCLEARAGEADRLVRREQWYAGCFEAVLDEGAEVGAAGDALDGLADDGVEVPLTALGHGEEVLDASVAWDRNVEAFMAAPVAACGKVLPPGFDVVVETDDDDSGREHRLARADLPGKGDGGVLLVLRRGAAEEDQPGQLGRCPAGGSGPAAGPATGDSGGEEFCGVPVRLRCCAIHVTTSTMTCLWSLRSASASSPVASWISNVTSGAGDLGF
ncbi:hypothetical protein ACWEKM_40270 [Streptomyces sp. NPDC004752]